MGAGRDGAAPGAEAEDVVKMRSGLEGMREEGRDVEWRTRGGEGGGEEWGQGWKCTKCYFLLGGGEK